MQHILPYMLHLVFERAYPITITIKQNPLFGRFCRRRHPRVLHYQHPERIRLNGSDCPEKGQAFGQKAKQAVSALAFGKEVTIQTHGHDKYKRILGDVILPDGTNANHTLVKYG